MTPTTSQQLILASVAQWNGPVRQRQIVDAMDRVHPFFYKTAGRDIHKLRADGYLEKHIHEGIFRISEKGLEYVANSIPTAQ